MSKEKLYIVSLSGGKDSTAMLLRLIEEKRPIDRILFCDTGLEFPQMYDHLNKLEQYIGRKITRLKAEYSFEYYFLKYMPKTKKSRTTAVHREQLGRTEQSVVHRTAENQCGK